MVIKKGKGKKNNLKSSPAISIEVDMNVHSKLASSSETYQDKDNHQEYLCWINAVGGVTLILFLVNSMINKSAWKVVF